MQKQNSQPQRPLQECKAEQQQSNPSLTSSMKFYLVEMLLIYPKRKKLDLQDRQASRKQ